MREPRATFGGAFTNIPGYCATNQATSFKDEECNRGKDPHGNAATASDEPFTLSLVKRLSGIDERTSFPCSRTRFFPRAATTAGSHSCL
mmetsp:Transcript_30959/g.67975  ORF Transcript_30959/g.67975 Transcript_30959/m.67975 type:complete len:89 (-) Transcript_30959:212-478(-)